MVDLLHGSLYPLFGIHKGIHTGNKPSTYRGSIYTEDGVLMAGYYGVIAGSVEYGMDD
jgi:hypothetical protein